METKNPHAQALGKIGGQATGKTKRRSPSHYKRMAQLATLARKKKSKIRA